MQKNNTIRRALALTLAIAAALMAFSGCSAVVTDPVVAKVGDVEIYYSGFYNTFMSYTQYGLIDVNDPEMMEEGRQMVMDMLVESAVPVAIAHKQGLTLDEEELKAATDSAMAMAESYLSSYMDSSIEDEEERKAAAIAGFNNANYAAGYDYDAMLADLEKQTMDEALSTKLIQQLNETLAEPTEEELQAFYEEELAKDKELYAENPGAYYEDSQYYSIYGDVRPLQAPEGLYYVKHILIMNEDRAAEEDKGRDHKALAEEVLAKVQAGEDFDALIEEYNEDPGMASNPDGYVIGVDFDGVYDPPFQAAAAELKAKGDYSGIVEGASGYHIILRAEDVSTEPVPLEEIREEVISALEFVRQSELYAEKLEEWMEELDITIYDKRVRYVGAELSTGHAGHAH